MTQPARGLGRGLSALLDDAAAASVVPINPSQAKAEANNSGKDISSGEKKLLLTDLIPSSVQPRREFDDSAIESLANSIKTQGVLQPLLVRSKGKKFEIIGGERRWRAAQKAGLTHVPVIIRELDDGKALEVALVENIQRADLNPIEEAMGYERLVSEFKYTHTDMSAVTGKSRSHITNLLRLLTLPVKLKACVSKGLLTMGHARALLGLSEDSSLQIKAANKVIKHGLSVRETEDLVRNLIHPNTPNRGRRTKDAQTAELERMMQQNLGLKVSIRRKVETGAGSLRIFFDNPDQLNHLMENIQKNKLA